MDLQYSWTSTVCISVIPQRIKFSHYTYRHRFRLSQKGREITNMKFWGKDTLQLWGFRRSQNGYERFPQIPFRKTLSGHLAKDQVWFGGGGGTVTPPPPESFGLSDPHRIDEQFQIHILFNFAMTLPKKNQLSGFLAKG